MCVCEKSARQTDRQTEREAEYASRARECENVRRERLTEIEKMCVRD